MENNTRLVLREIIEKLNTDIQFRQQIVADPLQALEKAGYDPRAFELALMEIFQTEGNAGGRCDVTCADQTCLYTGN